MRVVRTELVINCGRRHTDAQKSLQAWIAEASQADWKSPIDVKERYGNADILPDNRGVFNIKGNRFRLVVKINYSIGLIDIRFAGTHDEYNHIDATKI